MGLDEDETLRRASRKVGTLSFISIEYKNVDSGQYICTLTDSDFGEVDVATEFDSWFTTRIACVVKAYSERNLPVGANIARLHIYMYKRYQDKIKLGITLNEDHCLKFIPNWAQYAKERDEYLKKVLPLL